MAVTEPPTPTTPEIDEGLVRRLLADQYPSVAELPLRRLTPGGSDHVIHRLGDTMSVRLPRGDWAAGQAEKESLWLPLLAPRLPLAIPEPLFVGRPDHGYPWRWSVTRWLDGAQATPAALVDPARTARRLAEFLTALHRLPPAETLAPGHAGQDLADVGLPERDEATRADIEALKDTFPAEALTDLWEAALRAPAWDHPPMWFHGDFHVGNLLTRDGDISAVIDFGGLGQGDPACDLVIAWTLLTPEARPLFRETLGIDDATWTRGRAWALTTGLNAHRGYAATRPDVALATAHQITEALRG
ncbi:aminoglycoside phosphotransferase family protein [Streptomyces profundus]|uniref:aminoglycoside phosphotransferase family protein n=1 Tax=Streptomyces profundus TaxID=2867410 RepID=UPI001D1604A0|nr:aminoglycoside phosphotransferase family protein [Streptomyces sp. MA3_2.13]UED83863.1 aminoglycoside phosphotransferase family protein [Streptomyces sp. MA3_2.13]